MSAFFKAFFLFAVSASGIACTRAAAPDPTTVQELIQPWLDELIQCSVQVKRAGGPDPDPYFHAQLDREGYLTELEYGFQARALPPECQRRLQALPRPRLRPSGRELSCTRVECFTPTTRGEVYPCYAYTLGCL